MTLAAATAAPTSPNQVRAGFEQLLGLHALLAVRQMRSLVAAAPDFGQVAGVSLQTNTDELTRLVATAYGGTQADRFIKLWQRHLVDLLAYAKAVAGHDTSATRTARAALLADADAYGSWLTGASKGRVRASDAAAGVRMHVTELMAQADAYAARDYAQADRVERQAYEHMFTAGGFLSFRWYFLGHRADDLQAGLVGSRLAVRSVDRLGPQVRRGCLVPAPGGYRPE
jgi:hypothetical protein